MLTLKLSDKIKNLKKAVDSVLFDQHLTCNFCQREVFTGKPFCDECFQKIHFVTGGICHYCGRKTATDMNRCVSCKGDWAVDFARSVFIYDDAIAELIKNYKYGNRQYLADIFLPYLTDCYYQNGFDAEIATFVPMTADKIFERGFNHSQLLAKKLAKSVSIEYASILEKRHDTAEQAGLNKSERRKNLRSAFTVSNKDKLKGKHVLIVDDVLTTGSTSGEIALLLKKAGARKVSLLTIASALYI